MKPNFERLDALPTSGPMYESFSESGQGKHSQGVIVSFGAEDCDWVGNFAVGGGGADLVGEDPAHANAVLVIAGDQGYAVNPAGKKLIETL